MDKILEAVGILKGAMSGGIQGQARFSEAMSTSDFAPRLGTGFEIQMLDIYKETPKEWEGLAYKVTTPDTRPTEVRSLLTQIDLLPVAEGEEYKAQGFAETNQRVSTSKKGRIAKWTYELELARQFSVLAKIPRSFASAAIKAENESAFKPLLDGKGGFNKQFFKGDAAPVADALTRANLEKAWKALALRKGVDPDSGASADVSDMYLIVHPALLAEANSIVNATEIKRTVDGVETTEKNPFNGVLKVIAPRSLAKLGFTATSWMLLPGAKSENPALALAFLQGHENPDIRVKNDQGSAVGGGAVSPQEGSFRDDTIEYRVRHFVDGATLFNNAAYASTGA